MLLDEVDTDLPTVSRSLHPKVAAESLVVFLFSPLHDGDGFESIR
jgi:hypothetical protein